MTVMDFPSSPVNGQTTTDGRYYFDSSVGTSGAWRSAPLPVGGLPAGSIMAWGTNTPPANWLIADGSAVSRSTYSSLFAVIGTQYGAGNGTTTFNLPDLRGRVPVGRNGGTFGTLAGTGGAETVALTEAQMPAHSHNFLYQGTEYASWNWGLGSSAANTINFLGGTNAPGSSPISISSKGSTQAHNNLQPYLVVNYIIKATAGWTAGDSELATRLGAVETASATTNRAGLVPVVPSSVAVGSGSATVSPDGIVAFTGASFVRLNNLFSSTYENYRWIMTINSQSNDADVVAQLHDGTSALSTNYMLARWGIFGTPATVTNSFASGRASTQIARGSAGGSSATGEVLAPHAAKRKAFISNSIDEGFGLTFTGKNSSTSLFPGLVLFLEQGGTFTGTIKVYGYR